MKDKNKKKKKIIFNIITILLLIAIACTIFFFKDSIIKSKEDNKLAYTKLIEMIEQEKVEKIEMEVRK